MRSHNDEGKILLLCSLTFILQFAWVLGPDSPSLHKMYPFSNQLITVQAYIDYFFRDIGYLILLYLMAHFILGMSNVLSLFFWLWLGYLIDYLLCYNEPFMRINLKLFTLPVSYSLLAGSAMLFITLRNHLKT